MIVRRICDEHGVIGCSSCGEIESLKRDLHILRSALEVVRVAEMMGLVINGKKVATEALLKCEEV